MPATTGAPAAAAIQAAKAARDAAQTAQNTFRAAQDAIMAVQDAAKAAQDTLRANLQASKAVYEKAAQEAAKAALDAAKASADAAKSKSAALAKAASTKAAVVIAAGTKPAAPAQPQAPAGVAIPALAAAAKLAPPTAAKVALVAGEATHEAERSGDKDPDKAPRAGRPPAGKYVVQIKAFRNQAEADSFAGELRIRGYTVSVSTVDVAEKGQFFRVRMGPFGTLDVARAAQKKLETVEGHQSIVLATP